MVKSWPIITNNKLYISNTELLLILHKLCYKNNDVVKILYPIFKNIIFENEKYIYKNYIINDIHNLRLFKLKMWPIKHDIKHICSKNFIQKVEYDNNNVKKIIKNPTLKEKIKFINNCIISKYTRTRVYDMYEKGYESHINIQS